MRYSMQYLKTANVNLIKDMGMIPYKLYERYGYHSTVVTYKNGEYPYIENEVKGLKIDFVKRRFKNFSIDGALYLKSNAKNIDVLHIFHVTMSSVIYAYTYKYYNPKGKIYLKLDCSHKLVERILKLNRITYDLLNKFLNKIDIISVEQQNIFLKLKELLPNQQHKMINLPNGIDYDYLNSINIKYDYSVKENIILNVARIGAEEKNTKMLLEAFASIDEEIREDWKLILIGPIEEEFKSYIDNFFYENPELEEKVIFKGNIEQRKELYEYYLKAKIFSLTSDFESFGIAFVEAAALGDIIIATDVGIAKEIVIKDNGRLVPPKDKEALKGALEEYIKREDFKELSKFTYELCKDRFDWNKLIDYLYENISSIAK